MTEPDMTQGNDPRAAVKALTGWTPFHLEPNQPEPRVHWLEVGQGGFAEPFFERTIQRRLAEPGCRVATTLIRALELLPLVASCLAPSGFIFHMSRTGSTLLANALKAPAEHLVISEPGPVNQLLAWPAHRAEPELWRRRFQGLLGCLGQPLEPRQQRFFVKFASHNVLEIAWILEAFPQVPWVFLYRDPREVLSSALERPPRWLRLHDQPQEAAGQLGLDAGEIAGLSRVDYGALVLERFCRTVLAAAGRGGLLVDYRQLAPDSLAALLRHFGLALDQDQLSTMAEAFAYDAKAATPRAFTPAPRGDFDPEVSRACAGPLERLYGMLEAGRAQL